MIAAGLLACWVARADSVIVAALGVPGQGFENGLPAMYSDRLATFELASDSLFNSAGNPLAATGLGAFTLASEPISETAVALPFNFSGAWVTSFSNLNLPAGVYWELVSGPLEPPDFRDWVAALPPDFEIVRDAWMMSFSDLNSPARDYWELLRDPLAPPDFRNWVAELPPAFEMARDWGIEL
jgi:hypothetical protein